MKFFGKCKNLNNKKSDFLTVSPAVVLSTISEVLCYMAVVLYTISKLLCYLASIFNYLYLCTWQWYFRLSVRQSVTW